MGRKDVQISQNIVKQDPGWGKQGLGRWETFASPTDWNCPFIELSKSGKKKFLVSIYHHHITILADTLNMVYNGRCEMSLVPACR